MLWLVLPSSEELISEQWPPRNTREMLETLGALFLSQIPSCLEKRWLSIFWNSRFVTFKNVLLWWAVHEFPNWRYPDCPFCTLQSFSPLRVWPHGVWNHRSLRAGWTRFLGTDSVFWKHSHDWLVIVVKWRRVAPQPRPFRWFSAWCD